MKTSALTRLTAAAMLACSLSAFAEPTLVQNVRVFDGERMHAKRSVLFDQGKIVDADFRGKAPSGARLVDGQGKTLLPGLIDAHVHAYRLLDLPLLFGVTTQVDMFTGVQVMQEMARKMKEGTNTQQADLFSAGTLVTAPGGHGTEYGMAIPTLTRPDEAQAFVDARIAEGSYFIKIVMEEGRPGHETNSLDLATVKAVIAAAHARGKLAVVHISTLKNASAAIEAGADGLVHLFVGEAIAPAELAQFVRLAKARKAFVIPTFSVMESIAGLRADDILADAGLNAMLDADQAAPLKTSYGNVPRPALMTAPNAVTAALSKAGVPVLAGTDAGNAGTQYGVSLHHELASLVRAGLTPSQALEAATSAPAKAFRLGQRGRIAKGYKADLVLVDGDPSGDIASTRKIVAIWKDGISADGLRDKQRAYVAASNNPANKQAVALPADGRISLFTKDKLGSPIGFGWLPSSDSVMGGTSTVQLNVTEGEAGAGAALAIDAKVSAGSPYPWAGIAFMPGKQPMQGADLSAAKVLRFRVRGDGQTYSVGIMGRGAQVPVNLPFQAGEAWREVVMPFASFKGIDAAMVSMIGFNAGPKLGSYRFEIADVRLATE